MKYIKIYFYIIFIISLSSDLSAKITIKYKIGEEIITNSDIENEKNYLTFLRPKLSNLSNDEMLKISESSLIKEIIKKKEINKAFKEVNNEKLINKIKESLFKYKNVKNEEELLNILKNTNIRYEKVIEKMKYEALWNELIFRKYNSLIKIDKTKLKSELISKIASNKKYEYNLSEILFEIENNEDLENKYNKILNYIKINDFKDAASRFSISNSSKRGGEIGWIKETLLSENLSKLISKMNKYGITKPLKYPNGYLILRINDKKEMKQVVSIDKELEELIIFEKNRQLNQFSLLFFKKLQQNTIINEY